MARMPRHMFHQRRENAALLKTPQILMMGQSLLMRTRQYEGTTKPASRVRCRTTEEVWVMFPAKSHEAQGNTGSSSQSTLLVVAVIIL